VALQRSAMASGTFVSGTAGVKCIMIAAADGD
jgi:hypothetical protein